MNTIIYDNPLTHISEIIAEEMCRRLSTSITPEQLDLIIKELDKEINTLKNE